MVDEALLSTQQQLEQKFRKQAQELFAQWQCQTVSRYDLQHVQHQLQVVAETHASMQLAVSQLQTVCPELCRLLAVMKVTVVSVILLLFVLASYFIKIRGIFWDIH
jgi:hypothetical protein